ncbi:TPA: hypothetical protein HA278_03190 [Candidatus Woesearchaeota archaeon]|nr:hypothetical protein [Candidatus Woesearchaeota archaeon]|tara:strand:- start:183 stop:569 length:387 start_codon:yes stop_codon:yes gene_type:complete
MNDELNNDWDNIEDEVDGEDTIEADDTVEATVSSMEVAQPTKDQVPLLVDGYFVKMKYNNLIFPGKLDSYMRRITDLRGKFPVGYDGKETVVMKESDFHALINECLRHKLDETQVKYKEGENGSLQEP